MRKFHSVIVQRTFHHLSSVEAGSPTSSRLPQPASKHLHGFGAPRAVAAKLYCLVLSFLSCTAYGSQSQRCQKCRWQIKHGCSIPPCPFPMERGARSVICHGFMWSTCTASFLLAFQQTAFRCLVLPESPAFNFHSAVKFQASGASPKPCVWHICKVLHVQQQSDAYEAQKSLHKQTQDGVLTVLVGCMQRHHQPPQATTATTTAHLQAAMAHPALQLLCLDPQSPSVLLGPQPTGPHHLLATGAVPTARLLPQVCSHALPTSS